jgi:hypothetical protein
VKFGIIYPLIKPLWTRELSIPGLFATDAEARQELRLRKVTTGSRKRGPSGRKVISRSTGNLWHENYISNKMQLKCNEWHGFSIWGIQCQPMGYE